MSDTILLDPDLFMALGFSAEAHGGMGRGWWYDEHTLPLCVAGHAQELGTALPEYVPDGYASSWLGRNDLRLRDSGIRDKARVPFERWCEIVGVDVAV